MKPINCPKCSSKELSFRGYRYNKNGKKRLRQCKDCNHTFTDDDGFKHMTYPKEVVKEAVRLYSKGGVSFSGVAEKLYKKFNLKVSRSLILFWVKKFKG